MDALILRIGRTGGPQSFKLVVEQVLRHDLGLAPIVAAELAEQRLGRIASTIIEEGQKAERSGRSFEVMLVGASFDRICGSSFVFGSDPVLVAQAKTGRAYVPDILQAIRSLTFGDFEKFGKKVLMLLGAANATVTQAAGDQGIDFFGEITLAKITGSPSGFFHLAHKVGVILIGQAKHYPKGSLYPSVVRELVGAMLLARNHTFSAAEISLFDRISITPFGPMVALLFTTGTVSSGARRLADEAGIIVMDGEQLAVYLADCAIGVQTGSGLSAFSRDAFDVWLD